MTLQEYLIYIRKSRNLTQKQFAEQIGITVLSLSNIERGITKRLRQDTLKAIANFLDIDEINFTRMINEEDINTECEPSFMLSFISQSGSDYETTCNLLDNPYWYFISNHIDNRIKAFAFPYSYLNLQSRLSYELFFGSIVKITSLAADKMKFQSAWIVFDAADKTEVEAFNICKSFSARVLALKVRVSLYNSETQEILDDLYIA